MLNIRKKLLNLIETRGNLKKSKLLGDSKMSKSDLNTANEMIDDLNFIFARQRYRIACESLTKNRSLSLKEIFLKNEVTIGTQKLNLLPSIEDLFLK